MKYLGTKEIETNRLILRKFKIEDCDAMFNNWANDIDVCRYLTWHPHGSINETKDIINFWINNYDKNTFYQWAIELKEINEVIGSISVVNLNDELKLVEIGYCISKKYWRKGITTEALNRLIKFFFEEIKVNIIACKHCIENPNSGKVMEKAGMKFEGILRQRAISISGICDMAMYSILKDEYFKGV
ncbi:MAG: GNAT family N-acetyltransferase [Erysipelotrichaceae bacterium]|nr:GNAT family N-acetyltransferase [Erysipelotrichaceae bacterium]